MSDPRRGDGALALSGPAGKGIVARPALFERLTHAGRLTQVSASAGSGKTVLVRSWLREAGLLEDTAWVSVRREEDDPLRFWLSVIDAFRRTVAGSKSVRAVTAAPDLDGWAVVERLLEDLDSLDPPAWLVIDDLHELRAADARKQLELLLMRAPAALRIMVVTRADAQLSLHRLRLEGELTDVRAVDLRFTLAEARALLDGAGITLSDHGLAQLYERTEGWAAGLRLAALSLAADPNPERFATEFSGSERGVAEYLLEEVLSRLSEDVKRLLLRTSVLERVNGELANALTGGSGAARLLQELEDANAFVISLDARRSWFRYHHLFADLLQLELRRREPGEAPKLHRAAAEWFASHGSPLDAVRHAQAAEDWRFAGRLLVEHWFSLMWEGQAQTLRALLARFPRPVVASSPELRALQAAEALGRGDLEQADQYLALAARERTGVPIDHSGRFGVLLGILRLSRARQRGDFPVVVEEAQRLLAPAVDGERLAVAEDAQAMALVSVGIAELWSFRLADAERHLEQGIALAARIGRPFLEVSGMAHLAVASSAHSSTDGVQRAKQAIGLALAHGWSEKPIIAVAYADLAAVSAIQGRLDEAEQWLNRAERSLPTDTYVATSVLVQYARGLFELARGSHRDARHAFETAAQLGDQLVSPHAIVLLARAFRLKVLVREGESERVEQELAHLGDEERDTEPMRIVVATLRLARGDPAGATTALAPFFAAPAPTVAHRHSRVEALVLEAVARDALGDAPAAERALDEALRLAELDHFVLPLLLPGSREVLEHHLDRGTRHAALLREALDLLAGRRTTARARDPLYPRFDPLSEGEARVLRYLPTNLSAPEIANELYLSVNTVRTHLRHIYAKLGAHTRTEAVERARNFGLLARTARPAPPEAVNSG